MLGVRQPLKNTGLRRSGPILLMKVEPLTEKCQHGLRPSVRPWSLDETRMTVSLEEALPPLLLILDAAIVLLCLICSRPLKELCIVALCCNGLALVAIPSVFWRSSSIQCKHLPKPASPLLPGSPFRSLPLWRSRRSQPSIAGACTWRRATVRQSRSPFIANTMANRWSNHHAGMDAGFAPLFEPGRRRPGTTQRGIPA